MLRKIPKTYVDMMQKQSSAQSPRALVTARLFKDEWISVLIWDDPGWWEKDPQVW